MCIYPCAIMANADICMVTQRPGGGAWKRKEPGGGEALVEALGGARRLAALESSGCSAAPEEARGPKAGGLKERRAGRWKRQQP